MIHAVNASLKAFASLSLVTAGLAFASANGADKSFQANSPTQSPMTPASFLTPDASFRPATFWAVNDRLEPEELARQFKEIVGHGFGGAFFHSRTGLDTEYLGEEWFEGVNASIEAAKDCGGRLWLYDEDQWPSGNVGGLIAAMDDRYRAASVEAELVPAGTPPRGHGGDLPLAAYRVDGRAGAEVAAFTRLELDAAEGELDFERLILRRRYEPKQDWFSGQSPVNLLEPEVTREFLRRTHELYRERVGADFGGAVPGIFTDEPNILTTGRGFPWWDGLPAAFSAWTGRDFWLDAPWMFFEGAGARAVRLDLHRTLLRQFVENYSKPVFEWCDQHGMIATGHYLEESTFAWQLRATWGGIMAHYPWMHMPGLDHLCRQLEGDLPLLLSAKQVSSVARQLGRKRVLVEAFACIRHSATLEDFRWLADANLALGANFFCTHMQVYSMRGRRKRDYPPNLGEAQTYWRDFGDLNDYLARLCHALSSGTAAPDMLILHPIENAMADHRLDCEPGLQAGAPPAADPALIGQWDAPFRRIVKGVLAAGYDCDLGDEKIMAQHASLDGARLRVGEMSYPVVIVPPSRTWSRSTFVLLEQFVAAGGKLVFIGLQPKELDCQPAEREWAGLVAKAAGSPACSEPAIQTLLDRALPDTIRIRAPHGRAAASTFVHKRRMGDQWMLFLANADRHHSQTYEILWPETLGGKISRWDPLNGTSSEIHAVAAGATMRTTLDLHPADSALLMIEPGTASGPAPDASHKVREEIVPLRGPWEYSRSEPNVIVIDRLAAVVENGKQRFEEDMDHRIRSRVARHFGIEAALDWQPWVARSSGAFNGKGGPVVLQYRFSVAGAADAAASLVLEWQPAMRVSLNGTALDFQHSTAHWERSFRSVPVTGRLREGENQIEIAFDYDYRSEIEPVYLTGAFGVRLDGQTPRLTRETRMIAEGSWVEQGMPFYPGEITYRMRFDRPGATTAGSQVLLRLRDPRGTLFRFQVNGRDAGKILWGPAELDLTPFLQPGTNHLEVTVVGSRQNTFGPLHDRESDGEGTYAGPEHYTQEPFLRESWSLHDYGLIGGAELVFKTQP